MILRKKLGYLEFCYEKSIEILFFFFSEATSMLIRACMAFQLQKFKQISTYGPIAIGFSNTLHCNKCNVANVQQSG